VSPSEQIEPPAHAHVATEVAAVADVAFPKPLGHEL
jgi:hypothetical protein